MDSSWDWNCPFDALAPCNAYHCTPVKSWRSSSSSRRDEWGFSATHQWLANRAALTAATKTPEVFACIVDIFGIANLITFMAAIPPYWTPWFKVWKNRLGDPDTAQGRAFLVERSPPSATNGRASHGRRIRSPSAPSPRPFSRVPGGPRRAADLGPRLPGLDLTVEEGAHLVQGLAG